MNSKNLRMTIAVVTLAAWVQASICWADFTSVGPFEGDAHENFSSFAGGITSFQTLDIFGGLVTVNNLTPTGAIKIESGSTLIVNGVPDTVFPRSAPVMMGQLGIMEWEFHTPLSRFGGYFENNSFADNVQFDFYGKGDLFLGSAIGVTLASSGIWTWNGWQFDVPVYRAVSTGFNPVVLNGFIWYDDLEITFAQPVPEPVGGFSIAVALTAVGAFSRRRVKCGC